MYRLFLLSVIFFCHSSIQCQTLSAKEVLLKCISIHDPNDNWRKLKASFDMSIVREGHEDRLFSIYFDRKKNNFKYSMNTDTVAYTQAITGSKHFVSINGKAVIEQKLIEKYNLKPERTIYLKEVYEYLFGIPMILKNDLNFLNGTVISQFFNEQECYLLLFEYLPKVENETWIFFINKTSFLLEGYQFFNKDIKSDGEYILLKDQFRFNDILFPRKKLWYWNEDDSFFRTDSILSP